MAQVKVAEYLHDIVHSETIVSCNDDLLCLQVKFELCCTYDEFLVFVSPVLSTCFGFWKYASNCINCITTPQYNAVIEDVISPKGKTPRGMTVRIKLCTILNLTLFYWCI